MVWSLYRLVSPGSVQGDRAGSHSGTGVVLYSGRAWFESDWGFLLVSSGSPGKSGHGATQAELLTGSLNKLRIKDGQTKLLRGSCSNWTSHCAGAPEVFHLTPHGIPETGASLHE
jgi:hypothetical protein